MGRMYPKTCERCGEGFKCGLSQCWCGEFAVNDSQYEKIVKQYHDCLCPACLSSITQSPPFSSSSDPAM